MWFYFVTLFRQANTQMDGRNFAWLMSESLQGYFKDARHERLVWHSETHRGSKEKTAIITWKMGFISLGSNQC